MFRNRLNAHVLAEVIVEDVGFHFDEVDDASKVGFRTDGKLDGNGVALESVLDHVEDIEEVRAHDVHLVYVNHARNMVFVGLSPDSLRLGLNTALGT